MNQEMKNRLLRLNTEALVEILESVCGYAVIELHFGQDPADWPIETVFYAYESHFGSWTVLNYDSVLHDKPELKPKDKLVAELRDIDTNNHFANMAILNAADEIERFRAEEQREQLFLADRKKDIEELKLKLDILRQERDEAIIHANNIIREARAPIVSAGKHTGGYWNAVDNFRRFEFETT